MVLSDTKRCGEEHQGSCRILEGSFCAVNGHSWCISSSAGPRATVMSWIDRCPRRNSETTLFYALSGRVIDSDSDRMDVESWVATS
jgi:hypothetical protein